MEIINEKIKYIRKYLKKTQGEFANDVDSSRSNIALIETGKATPGYGLLKKLTEKHNIEPLYFFKGDIEYEKFLKMHQGQIGTYILDEGEKDLIAQWIAKDRANEYYHPTKEIATKMSAQYREDISSFFLALNEQWKQYMRFMQFINQYDRYYLTIPHLALFIMANEKQFSREQLNEYVVSIFKAMRGITPIINELNGCITKSLSKLEKYDIDNTLLKDDWLTALKAEMEGDYVTGAMFLKTFDLVHKNYAQFPHSELKE